MPTGRRIAFAWLLEDGLPEAETLISPNSVLDVDTVAKQTVWPLALYTDAQCNTLHTYARSAR